MSDGQRHDDRTVRHASSAEIAEAARRLRQAQSPPEALLWERLRARRLCGAKFRRQHPIGPCVVDFYCPEARLAVEVDGRFHEDQPEEDAQRERVLAEAGIRVMRLPAALVLARLDEVLLRIAVALGHDPAD